MTHSYHIFMFPFRWTIKGLNDKEFSRQISFDNIYFHQLENWERVSQPKTQSEKEDLFNERNYFYEFVHDALYDKGVNDNSNVLRHYERIEPKHQEVAYSIAVNEKVYELAVDYINLNLYSTGVGVLSFYMKNEKYAALDDVLKINQFGRRVYPPYFYAKNPYNSDSELAKKIEFKGLNGVYEEDFSGFTTEDTNKPAGFITKMIAEVASNLEIKSVIDDRMYVLSWYKNDNLVQSLCNMTDEKCSNSDDWYRYVFVDAGEPTCQNAKMKATLLTNASYKRWQKGPSLYGISRYSFVMLTSCDCPDFLLKYFETEYVRMAELILVQKASVLRFSAEVTNISSMEQGDQLPAKVSSLYKEYIRFVNQIHFREVSAQDQAIEIYDMLYKTAKLEDHVKKLDEEIDELYEYVSLAEDRKNSRTMSWLTTVATLFVPATVITAFFGMNNAYNGSASKDGFLNLLSTQIVAVLLGILILILIYKMYNSKKGGKR